ncbi:MAG: hypothetical protein WDN69_19055 [Aliidongia sp.]
MKWPKRALEGAAPAPAEIARVLAPFFDRPAAEQPDTVVLACTHFPLLSAALQTAAPPGVAFIDSGRAVAERVRSVLGKEGSAPAAAHRAYFTQDDTRLRRRLPAFATRGFAASGISFPDWG